MLFGIAAMTIDLGLVYLTQVQMQNAADTAALEGLRGRDAAGDVGRRAAAANLVSWNFQNGFQSPYDSSCTPTPGFAPITEEKILGAGPDVQFVPDTSDGTELNAHQQIDVANSGVYQPLLQCNPGNVQSGDLVSGTFAAAPVVAEDSDYNRTDLTAAEAATSAKAPSFLARLRRTSDFQGLDNEPGVSSSGNPMPLLLGRGTLVGPGANPGYNPRINGLTIRGTAISDSRAALQVGACAANPAVQSLCAMAFSISRTCWASSVNVNVTSCIAGSIRSTGQVVGGFVAPGGSLQPVPSGGFVPIFDDSTNRIIGFGFATFDGTNLSRPAGLQMASSNASAVAPGFDPTLAPADLHAILLSNGTLTTDPATLDGIVVAPVIAQ